ncbi:blastula protease 10-like, partial [Brachionus plicatilis]
DLMASLTDIADVRYASHVFEPGVIEPKIQLSREPSEEKNFELKSEIKDFLIEGDILVQLNSSKRNKRKIVNEINLRLNQQTRWPQKIIPFEFGPNFPPDMISLFNQATDHWHQSSCIRFEPYDSSKHVKHRSRLYIEYSNICGSLIGYSYNKNEKLSKTNVYLGRVCSLGNIIHELGHAVGFRHEQSRSDRDSHVRINFKNLKREYAAQYYVMTDSQPGYYGIPYDLSSIMHYGSGGGTISALDPNRNFLMGQRKGLSFLDIQMANLAYKCDENCDKRITCQNGGFLDQFCKCFCPDGTLGTYCEKILSDIDYRRSAIRIDQLEEAMICSFEKNSLCQWKNDKARSTQDWVFNRPELKGYTETQHYFSKTRVKLGPQNGDRLGNKNKDSLSHKLNY